MTDQEKLAAARRRAEALLELAFDDSVLLDAFSAVAERLYVSRQRREAFANP